MVVKPSTNLQTVLKLIPELKPAEQLEVLKRLEFLTSTVDKSTKATDDWLEECICEVLTQAGLLRKNLDWRRFAPKGYRQTSQSIRQWLLQVVGRPLSLPEKYALGRVTAQALADYLHNTPGFGLRVMLQGLNRVPEALDASYPGYVAAGLGGKFIKVKS